LEPLASQLGHDRSFLLGLRLEGKIDHMDSLLAAMLAVLDEARSGTGQEVDHGVDGLAVRADTGDHHRPVSAVVVTYTRPLEGHFVL
jgi:hypothetical protein